MHHRFLRTVAFVAAAAASIGAVAATSSVAATATTPPSAFVRVEGTGATLLPQTLVQTQLGNSVRGHACPETSVAGALDDATAGNWGGSFSTKFNDYLVSSVLGETPTGNNFWTLFVNGRTSSTGACSTAVHAGDHVLWLDCQADFNFNCTNNPLALTAPAVARRGQRVAVHVTQIDGAGHSTPLTGAAVGGNGVAGVSGSGGTATITPHTAGVVTIQATKTGAAPSDPVFLCVYVHNRSECGSASSGPAVHVTGITEHQTFPRALAPRELRGTAGPDPSGMTDVSFSLTRTASGRCSYYDADRAAFRVTACGKSAPLFSTGADASWSYLLPKALGSGRYQLRVIATDGANRKTKLITGRSRIDFTVR